MDNLISICLATYNGEKYLEEQLDSLVNQTYTNIEVIVQDDCSTDNTLDILNNYKNKVNIIVYKNEKNLEYIKNVEALLKKTNGDFLAICDQDDIWELNKLQILFDSLDDKTLVYSNSILIDQNGKSLNKTLSQKLKNNFINSDNCLNFLFDNCVSAHAMLFKKELLPYIFPFPEHLYFDAWIAAIASNLKGVKYIDENLVKYRQHSSNTLGNVKKEKLTNKKKIFNKVDKKTNEVNEICAKIKELKSIKNIDKMQLQILNELETYFESFHSIWFNRKLYVVLSQNSNELFKITKKNIYSLIIKKSFGKKLYKVAPFL